MSAIVETSLPRVAAKPLRQSAEAPLAWLRLEPISRVRHHGVRLTLWPGGEDVALATCGAHGTDVAPV